MNKSILIIFIITLSWSCQTGVQPGKETSKDASTLNDTLRYPQEKHLANMRQLTFGGDNAEAYFSFGSDMITFQSNNPAWNLECDQIFYTRLAESDMGNKLPQHISTGKGRTTCSYFMPGDTTILSLPSIFIVYSSRSPLRSDVKTIRSPLGETVASAS